MTLASASGGDVAGSRTGSLARQVGDRAARIVAEDRLVYLLVVVHCLAGIGLLLATRHEGMIAYASYFPMWPFAFFLLFPFIYAMVGVLQLVHRFDARRRLAFRRLFSVDRLGHLVAGIGLLAALMLFQGTFTSIKNAMPAWQGGFPHDMVQADIDRFLHFGADPWHYLYAIAGNDHVRMIVEWNYNHGWFIVCYAALFWIAVAPEAAAVRTRYMLTYLICWVLIGNVLAYVFLSAGPAFYHHVTGDTARFGGQLAFLTGSRELPYAAWRIQEYLWDLHADGRPGLGSGISAFPSMHVSLVTLNALFLWEHSRRLGLVAFAYVAFVVASSVYLAWHYAIDGYAAIAITVAVFLAVRRVMKRRAGLRDTKTATAS